MPKSLSSHLNRKHVGNEIISSQQLGVSFVSSRLPDRLGECFSPLFQCTFFTLNSTSSLKLNLSSSSSSQLDAASPRPTSVYFSATCFPPARGVQQVSASLVRGGQRWRKRSIGGKSGKRKLSFVPSPPPSSPLLSPHFQPDEQQAAQMRAELINLFANHAPPNSPASGQLSSGKTPAARRSIRRPKGRLPLPPSAQ